MLPLVIRMPSDADSYALVALTLIANADPPRHEAN